MQRNRVLQKQHRLSSLLWCVCFTVFFFLWDPKRPHVTGILSQWSKECKPGKALYSERPVKPAEVLPQRLVLFWATTAVFGNITCSAAVDSVRKDLQTADYCVRFLIPLPGKNTSSFHGEMLTLPIKKRRRSIFSKSYLLRSQLFCKAIPTMSGTKKKIILFRLYYL